MTARGPAGYPAARVRHGFTQDGFDTEFAQQRPTAKGRIVPRLRSALGRKWKRRGFKSRLLGCFPIATWLRHYDLRHDLLPDLLTGVTLAVFHVPQSFGYSLLAGVSPIYGLYTSLFPMLMYAVFGTSRHASIGAFAVVSIMTGNLVEENKNEYTAAEVATSLSFLVGLYQLLFGMLRLGSLSVFLSEQLVSGFTAGVSVHIGSSQLPGLFGINVTVYSGPFHLIKGYIDFFHRIAETHLPTLALSATSFVIMLLIKILVDPHLLKKIGIPFPIEMAVVILGTLLSHHLNLEGYNMSVIDHIAHEMPRPHLPVFSMQLLSRVAAPALAVSVVSYAITVSLGRIFSRKHNYVVDPNQEFLALGACNLFGAFFACFPVGASVPRSSIQEGAGGKTQVVSFVNSVIIFIVITCLSSYFEKLPVAILCTIIFVSLKKVFLQVKDFQRFWRISKIDGNIWMVSFLATVVVDVQFGLVIGIIFSLLTLVYQIKRPKACLLGSIPNTDFYVPVKDYGVAAEIPGVKVFHFGGPIHFANSDYFRSEVSKKLRIDVNIPEKTTWKNPRKATIPSSAKARNVIRTREPSCSFSSNIPGIPPYEPKASVPVYMTTEPIAGLGGHPSYIIFDFSRVSFVDGTSINTMMEVFKEYRTMGISIYMAACSVTVFRMLKKGGVLDVLPSAKFFPSVHDAVLHTRNDKKVSSFTYVHHKTNGCLQDDTARRGYVRNSTGDHNSHAILTYGLDGVGSGHPSSNNALCCSITETRGS
ncbi:prestin-like [Dermacentor albipictus]|uniref:prestin-like n=1 Tax=Dermacentor albipictus TaxID=60249 RepID=UPI0038FCE29C